MDTTIKAIENVDGANVVAGGATRMENRNPKLASLRFKPVAWLPVLALLVLLGACNGISYDPALFSDDEWIAKEGDTYSYVKRSMQHYTQELDQGQTQGLALAFSGFYGKHSVWMIDAAADAMVTAETVIAAGLKGQYKVCLVEPDRQIRILADRPGTVQHEIQLVSGRYYVVLVGLDASGALAMNLATTAGLDSVSVKAID